VLPVFGECACLYQSGSDAYVTLHSGANHIFCYLLTYCTLLAGRTVQTVGGRAVTGRKVHQPPRLLAPRCGLCYLDWVDLVPSLISLHLVALVVVEMVVVSRSRCSHSLAAARTAYSPRRLRSSSWNHRTQRVDVVEGVLHFSPAHIFLDTIALSQVISPISRLLTISS